MKGFSVTWAVASAAESVMVMMKPVAMKPMRQSTSSLPCHQLNKRSSMEIDPSPAWTRRRDAFVHGERAEERHQHQNQRRNRGEGAGRERGDTGLIAEGGEVVDAGEAHDLPPGMLMAGVLLLDETIGLMSGSTVQQPGSEPGVGFYRGARIG